MKYHFEAGSQIYLTYDGRIKKTIKFSMLHEGHSYYTTNSVEEAEFIRNSRMFRIGRIREKQPIEETIETSVSKHIEEEKPKEVKMPRMGRSTPSEVKPDLTARPTSFDDEEEDIAVQEDQPLVKTEDDETDGKIEIDGVSSYMEAKAYLRNVVHASPQEISTKQKVQEYCQSRGIVFKNFSF